jgi:hypothetical protein
VGIFQRLFGRPTTRQIGASVTYFARIRDDAKLEVVGEAYRQKQVVAARPPGPSDLPPGMPGPPPGYYKAMLLPEPANPYDRNAISVLLWAGGSWSMSGYLSRLDAARFQPVFRHLDVTSGSSLPPAIACDAALTSERGGTGVILHMGTPGECVAELATDGLSQTSHAWRGKYVAFTGQGGTTLFGVPLEREAQVFLARWAGCEALPRLTKQTDVLIVDDADQVTASLQKARSYGVETIDEADFLRAIGISSEAIGRVTGRWARQ